MINYICIWSQVSNLENGEGCSTIYYWENECTVWKTDIKDEDRVQF